MDHSCIIAFWSPFSTGMTGFCRGCFTSFFKNYGDIQCLDCGSGTDQRTRRIMKQADLVAIVVRQERRDLYHLFSSHLLTFSNCVYLVAGYIPGLKYDMKSIISEFRIPPPSLACVPYCLGMEDDSRQTVTDYCYMNFNLELKKAGIKMLKALGF